MQKNEFIKQIRKKYKMSQKAFAELLEVSKSLIEKVEMGKIEATPENKYVKAVCALEGLDNEIFKYDEITDEVLQKHELSKFSKTFRKFLYFYYGDFWNEDINKDIDIKIIKTLYHYLNSNDIMDLDHYEAQIITGFEDFYIKFRRLDKINEKSLQKEDKLLYIFFQIVIILSLKKFKPSNFGSIKTYVEFFNKDYEKLMNFISKKSDEKIGENYIWSIYGFKKEKIKKDLWELEDKGLNLEIAFIKKLKELEKIQSEVIPAPTDPKDKQICELLQYAPPAFKDKIIEKLLQYKKDVEEF